MRVSIPLVNDLAIIQGETYQALTLTFPGDLTTWTPRGQIRTGLLEDAGTLLSEFAFATPIYDAETDTTAIYPTLTATQTANLPKTKWQGTGEYSRSGVYYYDVELESEGIVIKSKTAIVQVIGEVTGSGVPAPSTLETFLTAQNNLSDLSDPEEAQSNLFPDGLPGGITEQQLATALESKQDVGDYLIADATALKSLLGLTKSDVGLDNVDNTSDANKPISNATQIALDGKENADETILKSVAIGDTIQPFNADTVIDPDYVQTEESYTTAEKNKLAGIQAGAQVNPDLSIYATTQLLADGLATKQPIGNYLTNQIIPVIVPLGAINTNATLLTDEPILGRSFPFTGTIESVLLTLKTAPTDANFIVDIKRNGTSIFSTLLSVNAGQTTSATATTPAVLSNTLITLGDLVTFSVTQIGVEPNPGIYPVLLMQMVRAAT